MNDLLYTAYMRYFNALSVFGYKKYSSVSKLLFVTAIYEMAQRFKDYITEQDYKVMAQAVNCVIGTDCLFTYNNLFVGNTNATGSSSSAEIEEIKNVLKDIWVIKPIRD